MSYTKNELSRLNAHYQYLRETSTEQITDEQLYDEAHLYIEDVRATDELAAAMRQLTDTSPTDTGITAQTRNDQLNVARHCEYKKCLASTALNAAIKQRFAMMNQIRTDFDARLAASGLQFAEFCAQLAASGLQPAEFDAQLAASGLQLADFCVQLAASGFQPAEFDAQLAASGPQPATSGTKPSCRYGKACHGYIAVQKRTVKPENYDHCRDFSH